MFRSKNKRKFNSVCYYLASKLKSMWLCENPQKRRFVIQNGRQNKVVVITYVTVPTIMGYKENKKCHGSKTGDMAKINSGKSAMK